MAPKQKSIASIALEQCVPQNLVTNKHFIHVDDVERG